MENKKLFEILTLVDDVFNSKWSTVRKIVDMMPNIEVVEKKWFDRHKQDYPEHYPLDLTNIKTWSTYDDCVNLVFSIENYKLKCVATIFDRSGFGSDLRIQKRFTATLILPDDFIKEIESSILYVLDNLAEDSYEKYLENQKKIWMDNYKSQILGTNV